MIEHDFKDSLTLTLENIPVEYQFNSQSVGTARVSFRRGSTVQELMLNQVSDIIETVFDIEIVADDESDSAAYVDLIKLTFHGFSGQMGDTYVWVAEYINHDDDYEWFSLGEGDDAKFIQRLSLKFIHN